MNRLLEIVFIPRVRPTAMARQHIAYTATRIYEPAGPLFRSKELHSRLSGPLLDPLSGRELEVLHLVADVHGDDCRPGLQGFFGLLGKVFHANISLY